MITCIQYTIPDMLMDHSQQNAVYLACSVCRKGYVL